MILCRKDMAWPDGYVSATFYRLSQMDARAPFSAARISALGSELTAAFFTFHSSLEA